MDAELNFRALVKGNCNFNEVSLVGFSALPDEDLEILFDTTTIDGIIFKSNVLALRQRFKDEKNVQKGIVQ